MSNILIVTGARRLVRRDGARAWCSRIVQETVLSRRLGVLNVGDADGPDTWARDTVLPMDQVTLVARYALDGWVYVDKDWERVGGVPQAVINLNRRSWRWCEAPEKLPRTQLPLRRNDQLVICSPCLVLAFFDPESPPKDPRGGTQYTVRAAKKPGRGHEIRGYIWPSEEAIEL